jgi:hypothetical protein
MTDPTTPDPLHFDPTEFSHIVVDGPNAEETWTTAQWNDYIDRCKDPKTGGEIIFKVVRLVPAAATEQITLDALYAADGIQLDFEALRRYFHRAVTYALPHATGSSEGWRTAKVEHLAEWMANFLTAGIGPTLHEEAVAGGVKVARQFLADERAKNGA